MIDVNDIPSRDLTETNKYRIVVGGDGRTSTRLQSRARVFRLVRTTCISFGPQSTSTPRRGIQTVRKRGCWPLPRWIASFRGLFGQFSPVRKTHRSVDHS